MSKTYNTVKIIMKTSHSGDCSSQLWSSEASVARFSAGLIPSVTIYGRSVGTYRLSYAASA